MVIFYEEWKKKRDALIGIIKEFFSQEFLFLMKTGKYREAMTHSGRRWDGGLKKYCGASLGKMFFWWLQSCLYIVPFSCGGYSYADWRIVLVFVLCCNSISFYLWAKNPFFSSSSDCGKPQKSRRRKIALPNTGLVSKLASDFLLDFYFSGQFSPFPPRTLFHPDFYCRNALD